VLAVELGGERAPGQRAVELFLEPPRRVLAVAIEADAEVRVAENVVHRAEPVVGTTDVAPHDRMGSVALPRHAGHLEHAVVSHGADQLLGAVVRVLRHGEDDVDRQTPEQPVALVDQSRVGRVTRGTADARRRVVRVGDLPRRDRVEHGYAAAPGCDAACRPATSQSAMLRT
jgi:hypothetical protein